ncbi:MAG: hypothetical protein QXV17_09245 [Candidatus Micrarchaeaceae archaeon]
MFRKKTISIKVNEEEYRIWKKYLKDNGYRNGRQGLMELLLNKTVMYVSPERRGRPPKYLSR